MHILWSRRQGEADADPGLRSSAVSVSRRVVAAEFKDEFPDARDWLVGAAEMSLWYIFDPMLPGIRALLHFSATHKIDSQNR
jgi:hypothetical protein